ncbi:5-formaminoimidazole-4-carboxamide-1-(beta)-D-ribofuranosyl 5'-monophosphate synthetase [Candidatus Peregrinibacteria bacterium HGW-Peregrinibacteria-1]|jgi:5-formaminoimidazole-4-carboxamide-1-(beta)-D-ribofuranosyl 5'-monophosphate synthetase|nr:MAG: 5-formaminoimidazole-4-carboxamide-1-(beta)-D-ribofuranosyl 5'-monophosphate synthetase [Candidatus Peregrinibacteria bacterium HGW-Peregrinibacteria-1]
MNNSRNIKDFTIATLGSHTALQILKGARDEGFKTICICERGKTEPYESFNVADEIITLEKYSDFFQIEQQLIDKNTILIPHGSFVAYIGPENIMKIKAMHYGTKEILNWESDRNKEREWLLGAGIKMPKVFSQPEDIDRTVIVKFHGADGGMGYFLANSPAEFHRKHQNYLAKNKSKAYMIQEYIVGVPVYSHYFYSPIDDTLEIMSFDKRYESNADSVGRVAAKDQVDVDIETSYTVTGNVPIVLRESLLPQIFKMGHNVIEKSRELTSGGLFGPFCLEGVIDPQLNYYIFEISARIVAGTNPYINGSPYTWLKYNEPMSTGRRIARDIKKAIETGQLSKVLG